MQISSEKKEQRKFYKQIRNSILPEVKRNCDKRIADNFKSLIKAKSSDCNLFLVYVSSENETDTSEIINYLLCSGKHVAVPYCHQTENIMFFREINSFNDLKPGRFGISEPISDCREVSAAEISTAVCVVPGICFDRYGYRIGYGRGFYDRFLSNYKPKLKIGLCYDKLLIDKIAGDIYDVNVDYIITESEAIKCSLCVI